MKTRRLITTKPHKYGTRHLTAGEEYEVPFRHAIALVAGKKAKFAPDKPVPPPTEREIADLVTELPAPPQFIGAMTSDAAIDRLRLEAEQLGIDIDGRWGVARLQHEIAQAKR